MIAEKILSLFIIFCYLVFSYDLPVDKPFDQSHFPVDKLFDQSHFPVDKLFDQSHLPVDKLFDQSQFVHIALSTNVTS